MIAQECGLNDTILWPWSRGSRTCVCTELEGEHYVRRFAEWRGIYLHTVACTLRFKQDRLQLRSALQLHPGHVRIVPSDARGALKDLYCSDDIHALTDLACSFDALSSCGSVMFCLTFVALE